MTSAADAIAASRLADAAGVLHPLVVHFPIALLLAAVLFELLRRRREDRPSDAALGLLGLAALAAGVAVVGGWAAADASGRPASATDPHRWFGLATAIAAAMALLLGFLARLSPWWPGFAAYRAMLMVSALLVAIAGHLGGTLVHGPDLLPNALAALRGRDRAAAPHPPVLDEPAARVDRSAATAELELAGPPAPPAPAAVPATLLFSRDVRPILSRRCFSCHSGEESAAGLDLDDRASLLRGGESGVPAVVPGDPATSRLLSAIDGSDPELRMPPKGAPLSSEEIALIRQWIAEGAATEEGSAAHWHWSYRPPARPAVPATADSTWPRSEIDRFVLAKLEAAALRPAPEADRATLIRRASLDLIGLPPSVKEVAAFEQDPRPDAYERVVDRLLASPHYGEHWARLWLDLGRYADTHGYEKDARRTAWPWRDWLIEAFNEDLPYDEFSVAMLAGDLLPERTLEQVVATGFNRNTQLNEEGGTDPEEFRDDAVIDRTNTFASVWLGSTIACAQCHDHKYDPFSQREYYALYALFNQDDPDVVAGITETRAAGGAAPWAPPSRREELARLWAERESLRAELREGAAIRERQARWERELEAALAAAPRPRWTPLAPTRVEGPERVEFIVGRGEERGAAPGVVAVAGASPEKARYVVEATVDLSALAAIRLDLLLPPSPYEQVVGRGGGNIVLTEFQVELVTGAAADVRAVPLLVERAVADYEQPAGADPAPWTVAAALDRDPTTGWAVGPRRSRAHSAWFLLEPAARLDAPATLRISLDQAWGSHHTLARFQLWATAEAPQTRLAPLGPQVEEALAAPRGSRSADQQRALDEHFRDLDPGAAAVRQSIAALDEALSRVATATAMAMQANPVPRPTRLHRRGSFRTPGEVVGAGVPAVLAPRPLERAAPPMATRLDLAKWLFEPENPLVARVAVNRLWERLFGRGLVATSDDFGTQGEPPSHPELLDWLATEYPRRGWRQKAMLRELATSSTYRQASTTLEARAAELALKDPENRLLSRASRLRLEAESVRDVALCASGLLSPALGGPSVFPPQPPGVWTMIYSNDQWQESSGPDRYRRGLYTFARRTAPYPTFAAFDAPSREISCTRRPRTNTPLQALATLNDPQFVEAAVALGRLMEAHPGDLHSRLALGFQRCTARRPTLEELERLAAFHAMEHAALSADPAEAAARLEAFPGAAPNERVVEVAAMAAVAAVLLNLDETLTRG